MEEQHIVQSDAQHSSSSTSDQKPKKKKRRLLWRITKIFLFLLLTVSVLGGGAAAGYVATLLKKTPELDLNAITNMAATTKVYDADKQFMFELQGDGDRELIKSLDQVSPFVVQAFIAAEDKDFRNHIGINPVALTRAAVQNLVGGSIVSGASTITQQTVKNAMFPEQQRTPERKVQEMWLAMQLEKKLTKDEIMVTYLNWIYFGKSGPENLYGIERTAQAIFGISAKDLTLAQSTILAALPNNPSLFDVHDNLDNTLNRQEYILRQMMAAGYINQQQYDEAKAFDVAAAVAEVKAKKSVKGGEFAHLIAEVETRAAERLMDSGKYESLDKARQALFLGGYSIYTTINRSFQNHVDTVLNDTKYYPANINYTITDNKGKQIQVEDAMEQSGATLIDNKTGRILALGGGRSYELDQVNHATRPRQPGSTMKPIAVFGPAIDMKKLGSGTVIDDVPMTWADDSSPGGRYFPHNWDKRFHGLMTVRTAIEQSYNIPALKVFHEITPKVGLDYVRRMGVTTLADTDNNLAAGIGGLSEGLTVLEATSSYSTIPNAGLHRDAFLIDEIKDRHGETTYKHESQEEQVFDPNTAYVLNDMLMTAVQRGTGNTVGRKYPGYSIGGKTGTTNDDKDAWFIGYTPDVTLGIWIGYNMPYPLQRGEGDTPEHLWNGIMAGVMPNIPNRSKEFFPNPGGVRRMAVCRVSGKIPSELCQTEHTVVNELFVSGTEPHEQCDVHVKAKYFEVDGKKYLANDNTPKHLVKEGIFIKREKYTLPGNNKAWLPADHGEELPGEFGGDGTSLQQTNVPNLEATANGTSVTLSWNSVSGAKKYVLFRSENEAGPFQVLAEATGTSYTDSTVQTGKTYAYRIVSQGEDGVQSDESNTVTVSPGAAQQTQPGAASAPTNLRVAQSGVGLSVSWSAVPNASSYALYRSGEGGYQKIASVSSTTYQDVSVSPGATYSYKVAAIIDGKESPQSAPATGKAAGAPEPEQLQPPSGVKVSNPGTGTSLTVSWGAVKQADGYIVERNSGGGVWTVVGSVPGTSYTDTGLVIGMTYSYRIRSLNGDEASAPSAAASSTPTIQ